MSLFEGKLVMIGTREMLRTESSYYYYSRSERPSITAIREELNAWFEELPEESKFGCSKSFLVSRERPTQSCFL